MPVLNLALWDERMTAERLGISRSSLRRRVAEGALPVVKIGARVLFEQSSIRHYIKSCVQRAEPGAAASE